MPDTRNVKLGVCQVFMSGVDLGLTKGGVEVSVKTDSHKVFVDQYGKTPINEYIMGREVSAKVPMAETTIENMVAIMPGAVMTQLGGTVAQGTITIATNPLATETIVVNGVTITFKTTLAGVANEVLIGATAAASATALAAMLNASTTEVLANASYVAAAGVVTVRFGNRLMYGFTGKQTTAGNTFTLVTGTAGVKVTMSGATLTGGADSTSVSVKVGTGIGVSLLDIAKELRFHPVGKPLSDRTDDFVITLAATPGALTFGYKLEDERVYNVDFMGYPDAIGNLYTVGL